MFTVSKALLSTTKAQCARSAVMQVIQRRHSGTPNILLRDQQSQRVVPMAHSVYKPQSGIAFEGTPLVRCEEMYPKSRFSVDLDGMENEVRNAQALTYGGVVEKLGQRGIDYMGDIRQPHPIWTKQECDDVQITHLKPKGVSQTVAFCLVWVLRRAFDYGSGYVFNKSEKAILRRVIILETVAGIPGMVGGFIRHMRSLRTGVKDYGWIHSLLEEAENERMHLMIVMQLRDLGFAVRVVVAAAQAALLPFYFGMYLVSPKFCHSFVGYLEEEAVKTYTQALEHIDDGKLPGYHITAPKAAIDYYHLPEDASFRDVLTNIRADEAHHRSLNHCLAHLGAKEVNPFPPGY